MKRAATASQMDRDACSTRKGERLRRYFAGAPPPCAFRTGWTGPPRGVAREGAAWGDRSGIDVVQETHQPARRQSANHQHPCISSARGVAHHKLSRWRSPVPRAPILFYRMLGCLDVALAHDIAGPLPTKRQRNSALACRPANRFVGPSVQDDNRAL